MSFASKQLIIASISKFRTSNTRVFEQRRKFSVNNNVRSDPPSPSQPPTSSSRWILGTALAVLLPFAGNKWGPLLQFKQNVDTVVETIEEIVDVVEKVADVVDKVAENISDGMPEAGKLKKVVDVVEDVAEKAAKDAQSLGNAIDKLQEVEEKMGNIVDILGHESNGNEHTKEAKG